MSRSGAVDMIIVTACLPRKSYLLSDKMHLLYPLKRNVRDRERRSWSEK
jgi:hypothetical protein